MALLSNPCFFSFLFSLVAFYFAEGEDYELQSNCPKGFSCGSLGHLEFPFAEHTQPHCGLVGVDCDAKPLPKVQLGMGEEWYQFVNIESGANRIRLALEDSKLQRLNYSVQFPYSPSVTFSNILGTNIFKAIHKCNNSRANDDIFNYERYYCFQGFGLFYKKDLVPQKNPKCVAAKCTLYPTPIFVNQTNSLLTARFILAFQVSEACNECYYGGGQCTQDINNEFHCAKGNNTTRKRKLKLILVWGGVILVLVLMFILLLCITKKLSFRSCMDWLTEIKNYQDIPEFLESHGPLALKRFRYTEIKKITNSFKNELGQGGFGSVYKGKLLNGTLVAVKVLKELRASGEEFINEVASISRTSHVNIVTLIGFCIEGRKRALVYELMLNGSLEKFIYDNKSNVSRQLGWNMLYEISIGIARGLEYLHRGCNTCILHLDIKPHNILLDENFSPKISDFGLAKLCNKQESIVSIFGARGTIGYIAPEVVCKDIGGVSHKSDVYSYGMMVLEMVGGRRNVDVGVSRNSKIYFPHWIYTRLVLDDDLGLNGVIMNEEENEFARKMVIVSLWCIQSDPLTRPSMSRVVKMLEGKLEYLQIPPQPYLYSPTRSEDQHSPIVSIT